ncbi:MULTISPECIES: invasin domain 3-containing protein [unclassified Ectothiorhodospira]|uniref:Ig-like domain-containing protein n=1 Tax=unclassified Ectothiorhodospira TaxID=2684909 RepID=UPI001EE80565|nr:MULTISPECIES: invasin domain 3-containing protein [unclassified Ectothiorhodospira]MCG5517016.1 hypothetical protein [Ectothiorhodospira sp. 9100]MCG5520163.1 hypothetical protein [Ectothiorhodospira sp. 9905]
MSKTRTDEQRLSLGSSQATQSIEGRPLMKGLKNMKELSLIHRLLFGLISLTFILAVSACGGGDDDGFDTGGDDDNGSDSGEDEETTEAVQSAASIQTFADKIEINADGSDVANIQVLVKDSGNRGVAGVPVTMSIDPDGSGSSEGYNLIVDGFETNESGELTARLGSGQTIRAGNALVTATVDGRDISSTLGFTFVGPTIETSPTEVSINQDETETIFVTALSGTNPANNQPICVEVPNFVEVVQDNQITSRPGGCPTSVTTDVNGEAEFSIQISEPGKGLVRLSGLGLTRDIPVEGVFSGIRFLEPNPDTLIKLGDSLTARVETPDFSGNVLLATTSGTFANGQSTTTVTTGDAENGVVLTGFQTGRVTLSATKSGSNERDTTSFLVFDDSDLDAEKTNISLQATPATLSVGDDNHATLTATLTREGAGDGNNLPIPNELVSFTIVGDSLGTSLSAPASFTGEEGTTSTQFVAGGTPSSASGVTVRACIASIELCDNAQVTITDKPGSISIGLANVIGTTNDNTAYQLPISVIATDVNGGALSNVTISLRVWPTRYRTGFRTDEGSLDPLDVIPNEDVNRNVTRDLGDLWSTTNRDQPERDLATVRQLCEPSTGSEPASIVINSTQAFELGCKLIPESTAGGSVPATVTTDENGLATFNLTYLKDRANVIEAQVVATAQVQSTEIQSSRTFFLPREEDDDNLPDSPYNVYFE